MRRTPEEQLEALQLTKEKLQAREKALRSRISTRQRKEDNRRKIIVGAVVLAHAEHDPSFHDLLWTILENRTTRDADRKFLGLEPLRK